IFAKLARLARICRNDGYGLKGRQTEIGLASLSPLTGEGERARLAARAGMRSAGGRRIMSEDSLLNERRLVTRVLHHWHETAMGQRFPHAAQIDPWLVGDDWSNCALIQLAP